MDINQNKINTIFSDLTILNSKIRLGILDYLNQNRKENTFTELCEKFEDVDKSLLMTHLRVLYVSQMIKNDGIREKAKYSITSKGINLIENLKSDKTAESIISEIIS